MSKYKNTKYKIKNGRVLVLERGSIRERKLKEGEIYQFKSEFTYPFDTSSPINLFYRFKRPERVVYLGKAEILSQEKCGKLEQHLTGRLRFMGKR